MSEKGIKVLNSNNLLPSSKKIVVDFYKNKIIENKTLIFLRFGRERKNKNLDLVHSKV